jgi:hypothetical protein
VRRHRFVKRLVNPQPTQRQRMERTSRNDFSRPIAYSSALPRALESFADRLQRFFVVHTSGSSSCGRALNSNE